jgi:AAA ATPase domain
MLDLQPKIVHFSGHGRSEAGLVFEDEIGNGKLVDGAAMAGLFELFADQLHCVVLNSCYSEVQAKAISQHIPYVIGMNQAIGDKAAIAFSVGFYDALGVGRDVEFAFKLGCNAIRLEGIAEHLTPVLLKKPIPIGASAFITGTPIEHPKNFFGREKELKRLFNLLKTHPLQNVVITGKRRSGKTSLLNYLRQITTTPADQLRPRQKFDWLPNAESYRWIFVDFQDVRMAQQERLLRYLLESMELPVPNICDLESFMDQVSGNIHQPTVILLDEVQRCSDLGVEFWQVLRSLVTNQTGGNLAIVLASSESLVNLEKGSVYTSPFSNILHTIRLRAFTEGEARELINSSPLPFPAADIDWILKKSDGLPLLLQILCQERLFYLQDDDFSDDWRKEGLEKVAQYSDLFKTHDTA